MSNTKVISNDAGGKPDTVSAGTTAWRVVFLTCVAVFLGMLLSFWSTASGMVHIWYNFETYTHGFIVLPISLWLIWQKRHHLAAYTPAPAPSLLIILAATLLVWALARLTGVQVVEQSAFVGSIIVAVAGLLGWQVAKFLAFPLLFLFFAVPMGEDLTPPMMEFTATFTVEALKLTGIPVYRDGLWFSLPSGDWSVVEACSGVRYLIASATLGVMYAYITYHTLWKRLLFIAMSIIVPILANGLRAYMIVMIGHLSGMKLATGVDHLIYGWVFFGIVMFILFWIGSFWQEEEAPPETVLPTRPTGAGAVATKSALIGVLALAMSFATVLVTERAEGLDVETQTVLAAPNSIDGWAMQPEGADWVARHQPTEHVLSAKYRRGDETVQLFVVLFPKQTQGLEAINTQNSIAEELVRMVKLERQPLDLGVTTVDANRQRAIVPVAGRPSEHLVFQWYRVAGHSVTNRYVGKAWEALSRLYPGRADGAWIAISTPLENAEQAQAQTRLEDFAKTIGPIIDIQIDDVVGINAGR